ncbi:carbohydrate kinase [Massilia sp. S19_KUP03_FR1]|uniref:carbohydrate kinase n=1 Tax=Massilia sp. S19_KUP03_FR1 TaxID=3025503 RepID=UPI002FCD35AD
MADASKKELLYALIRDNPYIAQQDLAEALGLSRSAVAGHIAALIRERRLLGRAYVLPDRRPIVCIGAANLDRKLRSLAPLTMGTSNPAHADESFGGVARNIAENLARLGSKVALITAVGDDAAGAALLAHAAAIGIDTGATLKLADTCSGTYTAVLDGGGEMVVALADMALYDQLTPACLDIRATLRSNAAMVLVDLNLPRETVAALIDAAGRDQVPLIIVAVSIPKMARLPASLHGVRLVILNEGELAARVRRDLVTDSDVAAACRALQDQGARDVIVTRGALGVWYTSTDGVGHLPAPHAEPVDVTGAGDAFAAAVCHTLNLGGDLALACRRGLELSALTLACTQTVCPTISHETFRTPLLQD